MKFDINQPLNIEPIIERKKILNIYHAISLVFVTITASLITYSLYVSSTKDNISLVLFFVFCISFVFLYCFIFQILDINGCDQVNNDDCENLLKMIVKNESVNSYIMLTNKQGRPIYNYEYYQLARIVSIQDRNEMIEERERQQTYYSDKLYNKIE
jgi:hypothetical protein